MAVLLAFAFVSGIITILSPCILPVLPIVLSGSVGGGRARPFGVLAGFVVSFTVFTLALTAIVQALGLPSDALRLAAVAVIVLFGLVLIVPRLGEVFERLASRLARFGAAAAGAGRCRRGPRGGGAGTAPPRRPALAGLWGGLPVGLGLGLVWTPCVGPIMASVISLALTRRVDGGAALITLAYTLGTSIPMLAVMLGGRALLERVPFLTRHTPAIQRVFGVLMVVVGLAVALGWDLRFQQAVLRAFPGYGAGLTALEDAAPVREALESQAASAAAAGGGGGAMMSATSPAGSGREGAGGVFRGAAGVRPPQPAEGGPLPDLGLAPPFVTAGSWLNTGGGPLDLEALRGKVVLVDFWTYSCVNCVRTIPYLQDWYRTYRDRGLVIIGVHTPEFEFEKSTANVERAMRDLGVEWPVVQDNDYAQWNAYGNRYWPAKYFIDAQGRVRWFHFGEGQYAESEKVIQELLLEAAAPAGLRRLGRSSPAPTRASRT